MTYSAAVIADSPLFYWKMDELSGAELAATVGSTPITLGADTAKPTLGVDGATTALGKACQFDGSNDIASVAIDLSARSAVVIEFWLYWDAFSDNDDIALEFTPNGGGEGFSVIPNSSAAAFLIANWSGGALKTFTRPSGAAWHHYAISLDRAQSGAAEIVYASVDGATVSLSTVGTGDSASNYDNSTLYIMSRNNTGLWGAGRMQHLAIYSALTSGQATAHYDARNNFPGPPPVGGNRGNHRYFTRRF